MKKDTLLSVMNRAKEEPTFFEKVKLFFRMIKAHFNGTFKIKTQNILIVLFAFIYVIIPFDFDMIPLLGWLDDLTILGFAIAKINSELERFILETSPEI